MSENDSQEMVPECRWCLVGNIGETHLFGEEKDELRGTKHFTPGTKVHCLPAQWGDGYEKVVAVGLSRDKRLVTVVTRANHITNWRAKRMFNPAILERVRRGIDGFNSQWESREQVEQTIAGLTKRTA